MVFVQFEADGVGIGFHPLNFVSIEVCPLYETTPATPLVTVDTTAAYLNSENDSNASGGSGPGAETQMFRYHPRGD